MGLTILLTVIMMSLLWLMIWSATVTLPYKGLIKNFPKDVQERLEPRLNDLPMRGKRIAGWQDLGYNRRQQLGQIVMIPVACSLTAWIFTMIG